MFLLLFLHLDSQKVRLLRKLSGNENYYIITTISHRMFVLSEKPL